MRNIHINETFAQKTDNKDGPFLYMGPNTKSDLPVFYLIVNRVDLTRFERVEDLINHLIKFVEEKIGRNKPFAIVIGSLLFSVWCNI